MIPDKSKFLGSVLIVIGTAVGAGMLAIPIVSAAAGFLFSLLLIITIWFITTITGLLVLEVNLALPEQRNSFNTMAAETIGKSGKIVTWISCLLLLYALTAAYIAGNASLLTNLFALFHVVIPSWVNAILFVLVLGGAVFWSTKSVDYLNRGLITIKGLLLIVTLTLLLPHVNFVNLMHDGGFQSAKYLLIAAPIFLCSFGFHVVIPSIRNYVGHDQKLLKKIIVTSMIVTLVIYLLWLMVSLGTLPLHGENSFTTLAKENGSVGEFVKIICIIVNSNWVTSSINGFANIAMTTSFLGVSLGLFDFLADGFKRSDTRFGRLQTAVLTFTPPLAFAIFYPKGFILALGYASIFVAVLVIILPALMAYKLRKHKTLKSPYKVKGGNFLLVLLIIIGFVFIGLQILTDLNWLPKL